MRVRREGPAPSMIRSLARMPTSRAASRLSGISFQTVPFVTASGKITPATPRISRMLAMLLPRMLPMVMPASPRMLAVTLTASSGREVPNATTVRPMARSETCRRRASAEAPLTNRSAPLITITNPTAMSPYTSIAATPETLCHPVQDRSSYQPLLPWQWSDGTPSQGGHCMSVGRFLPRPGSGFCHVGERDGCHSDQELAPSTAFRAGSERSRMGRSPHGEIWPRIRQ